MPRSLLLVEDNEDDVFFMQVAMKRLAWPHQLEVARDGREAKRRLQAFLAAGRDADPLALVLLDLRLPYLGGIELLAWMRAAGMERFPPVVVLSTTDVDIDLKTAAQLGAAGFRVKPSRPDELADLLRTLEMLWLSPPGSAPGAGGVGRPGVPEAAGDYR